MLGSALLSLVGSFVIIFSALRFRELSKVSRTLTHAARRTRRRGRRSRALACSRALGRQRFFAIRLIFFLATTDCFAAAFNILGVFVDVDQLLRPDSKLPFLCEVQAVGLLYFNLASIMWTSCFAFTLYRDVAPSYRRQALRTYELYFHLLCWPLPALLCGSVAALGYLGDSGGW